MCKGVKMICKRRARQSCVNTKKAVRLPSPMCGDADHKLPSLGDGIKDGPCTLMPDCEDQIEEVSVSSRMGSSIATSRRVHGAN